MVFLIIQIMNRKQAESDGLKHAEQTNARIKSQKWQAIVSIMNGTRKCAGKWNKQAKIRSKSAGYTHRAKEIRRLVSNQADQDTRSRHNKYNFFFFNHVNPRLCSESRAYVYLQDLILVILRASHKYFPLGGFVFENTLGYPDRPSFDMIIL